MLKIKRYIAAIFAALLLAVPSESWAVTRGELLEAVWGALDYKAPSELSFPPDVDSRHQYARAIGGAARYGLILRDAEFSPDEEINRHQAVRLCMELMGWRFELSLYDALSELPEFGASGDAVFFMAAEMQPAAPSALLVDGATALSPTGRDALVQWVRACKGFVRWNRVFSYGGTELSLFRQGVARPGEPNEPGTGSPIGARECEPFYVAAVSIHPEAVDTRIAFSSPFGIARVAPSLFSGAYDALAVVNGGFFDGGRPIGTMLLNGIPSGKPFAGRSAIGWNNASGTIVFGRGDARVGVKAGTGFTEVERFNVNPGADEASLFNADLARSAIGIAPDAIMIIAKDGYVTEIRDGQGKDYWVPEGHVALAARGRAKARVASAAPGDRFEIESVWSTRAFADCTDLIQAGPMLLRNGQIASDPESFKPDITAKRHPRTIVGTDGTKMIWAVIDGRSSIHSRGATIEETSWIAKSLGMTSALNLDGGGSSQLVWRGVRINSPSDGRERPLPYTVVMLPRGDPMVWHAPAELYEPGSWALETPDEPESEEDAAFRELYQKMFKDKE